MRKLFPGVVGLLLLAGCGAPDPVSTSWRNDVAGMGWDMVSFYQGEPKRGRGEFAVEHEGVEWHFATEANATVFSYNPDAFLPEYGGYDVWALAHGKLARGDPQYWAMLDGRLYFNFNARTLALWNLDREAWLARSESNWPGVLGPNAVEVRIGG